MPHRLTLDQNFSLVSPLVCQGIRNRNRKYFTLLIGGQGAIELRKKSRVENLVTLSL
jgi:hypothetical protein